MTRKRNIGNVAAIGGATAMVALLTGLSGARADELADLRANQQLLQQRIDQLAQAQTAALFPPGSAGGGGTIPLGYKAAPTAPSMGGSFPRSFLIPGTDTSIRVGGFIDITAPYYLQGANSGNPGTPSSNTGQNGNLPGVPVGEAFIPGAPNGGIVAQSANQARGNGVFYFSPQQSRIDIETRTPTAWGESRTFLAFDWAGSNNFSAMSVQQAGGDSLLPRLRFAYGTLGGFLGGQALSNFSDADADTESMDFGGAIGGTGGQRIPQVRYTLAGPYGSAFSASAEQPITGIIVPAGTISNDEALSSAANGQSGPVAPLVPSTSFCNGVPCTGSGITSTTVQANPAQTRAPTLTAASYWSEPWGHVDFAALLMPSFVKDGHFVDQNFLGYGGHIAGDVHPHWFGLSPKDDFQFSFIAGDAIGPYASGGLATSFQLASNFSVNTSCATPTPTCTGLAAASNILVKPIFAYSMAGGYVHWWLPNLRTQIAAGNWQAAVPSQIIGPTESNAANKQLWNAFVTLVWNPVAFITTGVEYMYGRRVVVSNAHGTEQAFVYKWRVAF